jgi:hypothetical protein
MGQYVQWIEQVVHRNSLSKSASNPRQYGRRYTAGVQNLLAIR